MLIYSISIFLLGSFGVIQMFKRSVTKEKSSNPFLVSDNKMNTATDVSETVEQLLDEVIRET